MFPKTSTILYFLIVTIFTLIVLYVWRKLTGVESYTKILEKRISNLKKDNAELQVALDNYEPDEVSEDDATIIMNKLFDYDVENIPDMQSFVCHENKCNVAGVTSVADVTEVTEVTDVTDVTDVTGVTDAMDNEKIVTNVSDPDVELPVELPVVNHDVIEFLEDDKDVEVESVISETNCVYNRRKLTKMNVDKLKELCVTMNISTDGTKAVIIDRILSQ
jgi:hypothetical protein